MYTDDFVAGLYDPNNKYMEQAINQHTSKIMPTQEYWMKEKILSYQKQLYTPENKLYASFVNENRSKVSRNKPTKEYWEKYAKKSKISTDIDDKNIFFSKEGLKMLARVGATRQELIENFDEIGRAVADELHLVDAPYIEGLTSIFDAKVDPENEEKEVIKTNPKYPPIKSNRQIHHHQEPDIIDMEPFENSLDGLNPDIKIGAKYCDLGHSHVCSEALIEGIFEIKDEFNDLNDNTFTAARNVANPYETIKGAIFLNRAAVKMANLDFLFNFTNTEEFGHEPFVPPLSQKNEYFYFADICAGPGGFTDYLYWRLNGRAQGFGMTLSGSHDWYPRPRFISQVPNFIMEYGPEKNGNIFNPNNIAAFAQVISRETNGKMVELVTADGGMDSTTEENAQECIHKRLVLCQFITALFILRKGGSFLCKVFDLYTDFSVEVVYLLAQCFEKFCIVKPYTSRPANSERYVVCLGLREQVPPAAILLSKLNDSEYWKDDQNVEITSFFDFDQIPKYFIDYLRNSNEQLVSVQEISCTDLLKCAYNPGFTEFDQEDIRRRCLEEWHLPLSTLTGDEKRAVNKKCIEFKPEIEKMNLDSIFPRTVKRETKKATSLIHYNINIESKDQKKAQNITVSKLGEKVFRCSSEKQDEQENPVIGAGYFKTFEKISKSTFFFD